MTPFDDRVLIRPDPIEQTTEAGLVVNAEKIGTTHIGTVKAVGPGRLCRSGQRAPVCVKPGDRVIYETWSGTPVEADDGIDYLMSEMELLLVVA